MRCRRGQGGRGGRRERDKGASVKVLVEVFSF